MPPPTSEDTSSALHIHKLEAWLGPSTNDCFPPIAELRSSGLDPPDRMSTFDPRRTGLVPLAIVGS